MSISLCEDCFKEWGNCDIYATIPLHPCESCGKHDNRKSGGTRVNLFSADPRNFINKEKQLNQ